MLQAQIKIALTFTVPKYTSMEGYEVRIVIDGVADPIIIGEDQLISSNSTRIRADFALAGAHGRNNLAITLYKDGDAVTL